MNTIKKLLGSRTLLTLIVQGLYNFFLVIVPLYPDVKWITIVVNGLAFLIAMYTHANPSTTYNLPSDGSSTLTALGKSQQ